MPFYQFTITLQDKSVHSGIRKLLDEHDLDKVRRTYEAICGKKYGYQLKVFRVVHLSKLDPEVRAFLSKRGKTKPEDFFDIPSLQPSRSDRGRMPMPNVRNLTGARRLYKKLPIITFEHNNYKLKEFEWGVIANYMNTPEKIKKGRPLMCNAQSEKIILDKKSIWNQIRGKRCLIPATGTFLSWL